MNEFQLDSVNKGENGKNQQPAPDNQSTHQYKMHAHITYSVSHIYILLPSHLYITSKLNKI